LYQTADTVGDIAIEDLPRQSNIWISNNYFESIGIEFIEGREFNGGDTSQSLAVTIITQEFAQELWPNESAIGKQIISTINNREQTLTVVGTIQPLVQASNNMSIFLMPTLYRPLAQEAPPNLFLVFNTRPTVPLSSVEQSVRLTATNVNRNIALERFAMLNSAVHDNEGPAIFLIMEAFALSALLLAAIGVFAVLSRSIIQRSRDIGICRALGANNKNIFLKYGRQGLYFLAAGLIFGSLPAVIGISYFIFVRMDGSNMAIIPAIALVITLGMGLVIFIASFVPAKYALRLQPGDALRYE
jgi:ABC-type antimicrobial peptide transport system permease subunit